MRTSSSLFAFAVDDRDDAITATRRAAYAGWISAGLTVLIVLFTLSGDDVFEGYFDLWSLLDAALMAGLAYGTYRGNRYAAMGLFGLYLLGQVVARLDLGVASGGVCFAFLFLFLFARGIYGAFYLHEEAKNDDLRAQVEALELGPDEPKPDKPDPYQ